MKETFYFSHDYNARSDVKIKKLIQKHGMQGYGIYWSLIEDLYQNNNEITIDYEMLSFEIRVDETIIKSIINDFDLFVIEDGIFGSRSVEKRLNERDSKSKTARDNARKRWGESDNRLKAEDCLFYILRFFHNDEQFIKCGITTESISRRYSGKTDKYDYNILFQQEMPLNKALELENIINESCEKYKPQYKFGGFLECYNISSESQIINIAMQRECKSNAENKKGNAIKESIVKEIKEKENVHPMILYCQENAPTVLKMKQPLTFEQCEKIIELYKDKDLIAEKLLAMENKPNLLKGYKSAYLTLSNWLKLSTKEPGKPTKPVELDKYGNPAPKEGMILFEMEWKPESWKSLY